jgi:hypothetical protein
MAPEPWPNDELTRLANQYNSDKGTTFSCAHGYTRIYQAILAPARQSALRMAEIGLLHGSTQAEGPEAIAKHGCPSLRMWADYLSQAEIHGFDIVDFTSFASDRIKISRGDQGNRDDLKRFGQGAGGEFDIIIDDGSHASHHQQIGLGTLFPYVADGGFYIVEDLHFQPAELELPGIAKMREFLISLSTRQTGLKIALEQSEFHYLLNSIQSIQFFDSISPRWPLSATADALAVIRKRGQNHALRDTN